MLEFAQFSGTVPYVFLKKEQSMLLCNQICICGVYLSVYKIVYIKNFMCMENYYFKNVFKISFAMGSGGGGGGTMYCYSYWLLRMPCVFF